MIGAGRGKEYRVVGRRDSSRETRGRTTRNRGVLAAGSVRPSVRPSVREGRFVHDARTAAGGGEGEE